MRKQGQFAYEVFLSAHPYPQNGGIRRQQIGGLTLARDRRPRAVEPLFFADLAFLWVVGRERFSPCAESNVVTGRGRQDNGYGVPQEKLAGVTLG